MFEEESEKAKSIIEEKYNVRPLFNLIVGNWFMFMACIVSALTIGYLINYYSINEYNLSATLLVHQM